MFENLRGPVSYAPHRGSIRLEPTRTRNLRLILQRVASAAVRVEGETVGRIDRGLLLLAGIEAGDDAGTVDVAARRVAELRIFADAEGRTNLSCADAGGAVLVVSQFTLLADTSRGRRPSFTRAAPAAIAAPLVERLRERLAAVGLRTAGGRFGAEMRIDCELDGPFTIALEFPPAAEELSSTSREVS
jgi:D-tyrosyl-tRNA(Tyr) deacylase